MAIRLILLSIVALLAIAGLVMASVSLMEVTFLETESYVAAETYTRTEMSTEEVVVDYEVLDYQRTNLWWRRSSDCWVTLENTGNVSGQFRVQFDILTELGWDATKVVWREVQPGEQKAFTIRYYEDYVESFTYSIAPPLGEVTVSREVADTRNVVKYREVEKTDKVTVLEYLRKWRGKS